MATPLKVEFHFDFGSPNAYLAELALPGIEQRTGVKFDYVPVLLGGVYKATGNMSPADSLRGVKNKPEYNALETQRFLSRHNITKFKSNPFFPVNTLMLMRGAVAAEFEGLFEPYFRAAYHHMWVEPKKMDDPQVFRDAFLASGLDIDRIVARAQQDEVKKKLIENTNDAVTRGTFGSPTFFVGNEIYFGKDSLREVEEEIVAQSGATQRKTARTYLRVQSELSPERALQREVSLVGRQQHTVEMVNMLPHRIHEVMDPYVAASPDRTALIDDHATLTYRELDHAVDSTVNALRALGIRAGDRLMLVSENSIPLACLLFAASRLDVWAIVANPRLSPRELDQIRDHSGARRMLFTADVSEEAAAHAARYDAPVQDVGTLRGIGVSALNEVTQPEPVEADGARQVAVLIYTSGTTGTPKGVMLTHRNLLFSARSTARLRNMTSDDVQYCVLPISHIVGISLLTMTLMVGAVTRLVSKYSPAALAKALAEEDITILNGVPATYQRLLEYKQTAGLPKLERGALRLMGVAGAPLDLELKARVEKELGLPLFNAFGITECSPGISSVRPEAPRSDNSVGTLISGIEARIVGLDGAVATDGQIGELHVRGPNVMRGYYRAPDLTAKAIDFDGWFNTGDLARFEGDALFIAGRTKEMIIRSGFNVYPAEIEAVLSTHSDVVQCAVVGRPVESNEEIVAFVQLLKGTGATAQDLMAHVAPQLTSYKRPSEIILMDALPATSTGKLLKHKLAESLRK